MQKIEEPPASSVGVVRSGTAVQTPCKLEAARLILTLCLGLCAATAEATDSQRRATLEAIHNLENPRNLMRPGPRGELGAYQFRESTWRAYTTEPFARALDRARSDYVATQHYEWLKRRLEMAGVPVTPYTIALAWNGGVSAAINRRSPAAARNYAERAANLASLSEQTATVADAR